MCRQDTEFPGVVARPIGSFKSSSDFHYQTLRCNVDLLKIIQIGLTLCNEEGQLAPGICTFQFNFKFSLKCATARLLLATAPPLPRRQRRARPSQHALTCPVLLRSDDMYSQDSINLLERSGLNFAEHEERGIDPIYFSELLISSGIVLCDDVKWISFHSGYDFGYLLKVLTCTPLPADEDSFFELLRVSPCPSALLGCTHLTDATTDGRAECYAMPCAQRRARPRHSAHPPAGGGRLQE